MNTFWEISVAALVLTFCVPVLAQGDGPPPDDVDTFRERVAWLLKEVGVSHDNTTIRESIQITDAILQSVIADLVSSASSVEELKIRVAESEKNFSAQTKQDLEKQSERIHGTIKEEVEGQLEGHVSTHLFSVVAGLLGAIIVALGGYVFRIEVKVGVLTAANNER